jgi:hypothetical protein
MKIPLPSAPAATQHIGNTNPNLKIDSILGGKSGLFGRVLDHGRGIGHLACRKFVLHQ